MKTIWAPLPGSQTLFLTCPVYEVLLEGTRGGGKTDTLLMSYAQHVGRGFGDHWRGALFRLTYPQLADVVAKSKRWFYQIFPGAKFNESDYVWKWPAGEMLYFRYGANEDDYWNYHGHEYCVTLDTPVLTSDGFVEIGRLRVGDKVITLDGEQRITRTFEPQVKECVRAYVYDDHQRLIGSQVQSVDHQLLTNVQKPYSWSSELSRSFSQFDRCSRSWQGCKSPPYGYPKNQGVYACLKGRENYDIEFLQTPPEFSQRRPFFDHLMLSAHSLDQALSHPPQSTRSHYHGRWREQGLGLCQANEAGLWDFAQLFEPFQSRLDLCASSVLAYAPEKIQAAQDFQFGCHPFFHLSDEQPHDLLKIDPGGAPFHGGAEERVHVSLLEDVSDSAHTGSRCDDVMAYPHPYSGKIQKTNRRLKDGWVVYESCGSSLTMDITVEKSNHYITETGLINKNCWLGFEELTNWRNLSFYEAMLSTCRSSQPGIPRMVRATCNPFGVGHASVKERFQIGNIPAGKIIRQEGALPRVRIHSTIYENTILLKNDPNYLMSLESLSDPNRRRAWLEGDWDIHVGSFLEGVWQPSKHVVEPFAIPPTWKVWRSMDWGYARPYAVYWFALSNDGVYYLWRELYGYGDKENTGTREDATVVAEKIKKIEIHDQRLGYEYRMNLADPSIFSKIGAERSIGQIFRDKGVKWTEAYNAPRSRVNGAQEIIRLLAEDRLKIFSTCKHWLRTIPQLPPDSLNPEDVDTDAEDHAWDATRYGVMRARRASEANA
ncbi:hypothetical protein M2125_000958 [Polynucleobacter sphagniphilus]|nr:hypothetical protein [Polynucleobacter sphagniphilus]MDH6241151.1 hypothetical protein [Polynucleobacter sphagniphilus]